MKKMHKIDYLPIFYWLKINVPFSCSLAVSIHIYLCTHVLPLCISDIHKQNLCRISALDSVLLTITPDCYIYNKP